jgi:hypothetical protein
VRRTVRLLLAVALALPAAACVHHMVVPPRSTDPNVLVLRIRTAIGMPAPHIAELPEFSMYGDGRVLRPGPTVGALQTIDAFDLGARRADEIYRSAHVAGLDRDGRYSDDDVLDAGLLVTTLRSGDRRHVIEAVEGGHTGTGPVGRIERFRETLRPGALPAGPPVPYRPHGLVAIGWGGGRVTPGPSDAATGTYTFPAPGADVRDWPFASFIGAERTKEGVCVPLSGADLTAADRLARQATPATLWRMGTDVMGVVFRPLLPDERSCADIDWD